MYNDMEVQEDELYNTDEEDTHKIEGTAANNESKQLDGEGVKIQLVQTVVEEKRKSLFYILFFTLSAVAIILLVGVIIVSLVMGFCPGGRMTTPVLYPLPSVRRRGTRGEEREEDDQGDKMFNARICQIE